MSTNAIKTRVKRLISEGIIQRFVTLVDHTIFGYSEVCYLIFRHKGSTTDIESN
jgi:DNA-binding Lrp family transcriptional regulator